MIPALRISGFKLFRELELPQLGNLNLFVGKNNSGKTCLLEAVELYFSSSPADLFRVAARRDFDNAYRMRIARYDRFNLGDLFRPILGLFHRDRGSNQMHRGMELFAGNPNSTFQFDYPPLLSETVEMEPVSTQSGELDLQSRRSYLRQVLQEGVILTRGNRRLNSRPLDRYLNRFPVSEEELEAAGWIHPDSTRVAFLPARGFTNEEAKRLWDKASLADKDELLLEWLRIIEPEIRDLRYISDSNSNSDLPYLKISGDRGRVPLTSMGDGLTRLFHIGLAMTDASGGILLIDEFENGLHWEVQKELWAALFKASKDFGIQIFATTHSTDCLRGFLAAENEVLKLHKNFVYRLERRGEDVLAVELPVVNLDAALHQQVEVR